MIASKMEQSCRLSCDGTPPLKTAHGLHFQGAPRFFSLGRGRYFNLSCGL